MSTGKQVSTGSQRLISRYNNRRLYDHERSRYITLADIRALTKDGIDFIVVGHENHLDITCKVLLQAILECEDELPFTRTSLTRLIRKTRNSGRGKSC